jgi:hypothetical protein
LIKHGSPPQTVKKNPDLGLGFSALKAGLGKHEILYQEKISSARPKLPRAFKKKTSRRSDAVSE